jgi:hypothetical protein
MPARLVESLRGVGAIHAGDRLLRVTRYDLSVWSDDKTSESGTTTTAGTRIDGHIEITGIGEAVVLAGADMLTLTVEDGRRLTFQLSGSSGGIAGGRWLP